MRSGAEVIESIKRLRAKPGDTLVLRVSDYSPDRAEQVGRWLCGVMAKDEGFNGVGLLFLPDCVTLDHVKAADLERWGLVFRRPAAGGKG